MKSTDGKADKQTDYSPLVTAGETRTQAVINATRSVSIDAPSAPRTASDVYAKAYQLRNRVSFFFIGLCALSIQGFANSIAAKALGSGDRTAIIMISLYLPQVLLRIFTDYWTRWFSYHLRVGMAASTATAGLVLLYAFMEESSNDDDGKSLFHHSRLCVVVSMILLGAATTIGEVTASGYCTFFEKQCINCVTSGAGFGALLGAGVFFLKKVGLQDLQLVLACLAFPCGLVIAYSCFLKHPMNAGRQLQLQESTVNTQKSMFYDMQDAPTTTTPAKPAKARRATLEAGGAYMTVKLLFKDLILYTSPLLSIYFLYNIVLSGFIGPSYDVRHDQQHIERYETVFPYFLFTLRLGIFFGKSSGFMQIRKFFMFPLCFSLGAAFCGTIAYAPDLMYWFNHNDGGFWVLWMLGLPLGWMYGATPASVLSGIRVDCPEELREFALGNITSASILGQLLGNVVAIFVAQTVPKRSI